jgi:hypothetical protein
MSRSDAEIERIATKIGESFPTFGGGRTDAFNLLTTVLKDKPLMFAMGVDVRDVVRSVMKELALDAKHDPRTGPCPLCGFQVRTVERVPFRYEED